MGDEFDIAEVLRRLSLIEQDAEGERTVSLGDVENAVLELTKAVAEVSKGLSRLEDFVMVSQAELPRKFAEIAALVMREELAKRK